MPHSNSKITFFLGVENFYHVAELNRASLMDLLTPISTTLNLAAVPPTNSLTFLVPTSNLAFLVAVPTSSLTLAAVVSVVAQL